MSLEWQKYYILRELHRRRAGRPRRLWPHIATHDLRNMVNSINIRLRRFE